MSKDNSDYKKSLLPYKKGAPNEGRLKPLEDKNPDSSKNAESQRANKKSKR